MPPKFLPTVPGDLLIAGPGKPQPIETKWEKQNSKIQIIMKQVQQINKLNCQAEKSILEKLSHEKWKIPYSNMKRKCNSRSKRTPLIRNTKLRNEQKKSEKE